MQRRFLADLDHVCASQDLRPLFERMPCAAIHITNAHTTDSTPVSRDAARLVHAHSLQVGAAISRFVSAVESNGNRAGRQGAAAYRDWDAQRAREVEQLLAKPNLTWGELNRARAPIERAGRTNQRHVFIAPTWRERERLMGAVVALDSKSGEASSCAVYT